MSGNVPFHALECYETLLSSLKNIHEKILSNSATFFDLYELRKWRINGVRESTQKILLSVVERNTPMKSNPDHYKNTSQRAIEILSWPDLKWREAELDGCTHELREFSTKIPLSSLPHTQMMDDEKWYQAISNMRTLTAWGRRVPRELVDALVSVEGRIETRKQRLYEELYDLATKGKQESISSSAASASSLFVPMRPPVLTPWSSSMSARYTL